ncbi:hypothetical protein RI196_01050 [Aeribacillus composti]|uniref:Uncharacterized protein n=1 Tax=Aeribacillus composti TaxID=1868734 RepID=A0ABY9WB55_9BACI|nr:hypothetical protein [Aeribacillus composti]WNF33341.1 hypothetical protein RI196_01050 [Aeribacillus composti]
MDQGTGAMMTALVAALEKVSHQNAYWTSRKMEKISRSPFKQYIEKITRTINEATRDPSMYLKNKVKTLIHQALKRLSRTRNYFGVIFIICMRLL